MKNEKPNTSEFNGCKSICVVFLLCVATAIASSAQTFTTLADFNMADGFLPAAPLIQGLDGDFYGTTGLGGGSGNVFKISAGGTLTSLYNFCGLVDCNDGEFPETGLVLANDGNFYGTTSYGGVLHLGSVFKITPEGTLTTLYLFSGSDGSTPSSLIQGIDGNFYGTTPSGGIDNHCGAGCGTVFKITSSGKLTTLYSFCSVSGCPDGANPGAALIQGTDGNFYGTTYDKANTNCYLGCGTIFKITASGELTTLYRFSGKDGSNPQAPLVQASGHLYGTTTQGISGYGTVFRLTAPGELTTLYKFCSQPNCADGRGPEWLTLGTDGNFYGTTDLGGSGSGCSGSFGCGTVFKMTPTGTLTTLHDFCASGNCSDGTFPMAGLVQGTDGNFYGTTEAGGILTCSNYPGCGTIFRLSLGLGPFVFLPLDSGKVGQTGTILGQGFTGTTGVSLNGTPASFTVVSDTYIRATVPAGATSGFVTVDTPNGTLTSNVPFRVRP